MYSKSVLKSQLSSLVQDQIDIEQAISELNKQKTKLNDIKKDLDKSVNDNDDKVKGQMTNKYKTTEKREVDNHCKNFLKEINDNLSTLKNCLEKIMLQQDTIRARIDALPDDDNDKNAYAR